MVMLGQPNGASRGSESELRMQRRGVRPRDVWTVLWVTLVFLAGLWLVHATSRILVWMLIAAFLATVLSPLVGRLARRVPRGLAVAAVVVGFLAITGAATYGFGRPLVEQSVHFAQNLPQTVESVKKVPFLRDLSERLNLEEKIGKNTSDLPKKVLAASGPVLSVFKTVGEVVVALLTIFVLTIFLLIYGPSFLRTGLELIGDPERRQTVSEVGGKVGRMFTGWVAGNVITSVIAAIASLVVFLVVGLPYAVLLALWVGLSDFMPLVGATLGAIPAIVIGFIHSVPAGIAVLVFFIVYQQIEDHVLQPAIYGRTVNVNPFVVLVAILIGVELAGFLGALFAISVAGAVQIVLAEVVDLRRERLMPSSRDLAAMSSEGGAGLLLEPSERVPQEL